MVRSWRPAIGLLLVGVAVALTVFLAGEPATGVVELVVFVAVATVVSPLFFPRAVGHDLARQRSEVEGRPIVYWRPGCPYCVRLRLRLGRDARRVSWVNIWRDPGGAAAVRAVAEGNETVPTVVLGDRSFVNPEPRWVREQLRWPA